MCRFQRNAVDQTYRALGESLSILAQPFRQVGDNLEQVNAKSPRDVQEFHDIHEARNVVAGI
jgi:hypothetical protein